MARARIAKYPKVEKQAAGPDSTSSHGKATSKAEAVRQALSAGMDKPGDIADFARSHFGIDIPKQQVSAYKALAKKKQAEGEERTQQGRNPKAAVEGYLAPPKIEAKGDGDLLDALKAMKPLIARYGPDRVKEMVDLLG